MQKAVRNLGITAAVLTLALCAAFIASGIRLSATIGIDTLMPGIITAAAGIAGLIGAVIATKKLLAAGVLMIIAVVLCIVSIVVSFSPFYIVSIMLFLLSGFFALMGVFFTNSPLYKKLTSPIQQKPRPPEQLKL